MSPAADRSLRPTEAELARGLIATHPAAAARALEHHGAAAVARVLEALPASLAAPVLVEMETSHAAAVTRAVAADRAKEWLCATDRSDATRILRFLDPGARAPLLAAMPARVAQALSRALAYPPDTAAGMMEPRGLSLPAELTVTEALARFRRAAAWASEHLYVVGDRQRLRGVMTLRALLVAPRRARLDEVMKREVARLPAWADRVTILEHPGWRTAHELPVVDEEERLLGVLRFETARGLEPAHCGAHPAGVALGPILAVGELYWASMARLVGSLLVLIGSGRGPRRTGR